MPLNGTKTAQVGPVTQSKVRGKALKNALASALNKTTIPLPKKK